jgi:hypothetical protein
LECPDPIGIFDLKVRSWNVEEREGTKTEKIFGLKGAPVIFQEVVHSI